MADLEIHVLNKEQVSIQGDLTFATVNATILKKIDFSQLKQINIDLAQVENSDSAGLALMIEWIKLAKINKATLGFSHIPAPLLTLAQLSGLKNNPHFSG
ncbi:MAG: STAS domain-containing protein [Methylococcales bacterium]|nr:STAS domain-containing protein [Methylococcales bacterium]